MKTANWLIAKANAYGGVLLTRQGQVLLREPTNHFNGYVWTFAKGKPEAGDTPEQTSLREVLEETGYQSEVVDVLPGVFHSGLSSNAYFVMRHIGPQGQTDWETESTRWVDFETAVILIQQTTNAKGRERDLAVLQAARTWFQSNLTVVLSDGERDKAIPVEKSEWQVHDMPARFVMLPLDIELSGKEAANVRLGFLPTEMEQKWFSYFENNTLYQHRSWTGFCIDQVHFVSQGDGLRATHAEVNREPEQYSEADDAQDICRIENMVRDLGSGAFCHQGPSSIQIALKLASQPNYLCSQQVLCELFEPYFQLLVKAWVGAAMYTDKLVMNHHITRVMCEDGHGYTRLPGWHSEPELGCNIVRYLDLDAEYCEGESLSFIVSEGLAAVDVAFNALNQQWQHAQGSGTHFDLETRARQTGLFVVSVFMGTNTVHFPEQTLNDVMEFSSPEVLEEETDEETEADLEPDIPAASPVPSSSSNFERLLAELKAIDEQKRRPPFKFAELNISIGTMLTFKLDPLLTCVVTEKNRVVYQEEIVSLSKAAVHALQSIGRKVTTACGPDYWTIAEQTLTSIRMKGSVLAN